MTGTEARLVGELAARDWLNGDRLEVLAPCRQPLNDRYRVRGLDEDGIPLAGRRLDHALGAVLSEYGRGGYTTVRGYRPDCLAVGLYQAAGLDHAWLAITAWRVAVLRLRDRRNRADGVAAEVIGEARQQRSLGAAVRGLGRLVGTSAVEFARGMRRPPLVERPQDAVLDCPFEAPRNVLQSIMRWNQPMVPELDGGPRFVQVWFTDGSWARLQTDEAGLDRLLAGPGG